MTPDPYRLPRNVLPRRYELELSPDLDAAWFYGVVRIELDVVEPTDVLVLNAAELNIETCMVNGLAADVSEDTDLERLTVRASTTLQPGPATLVIAFRGILNDRLRGWYRSTYTDDAGNQRVIAASQMQATDCRRAFPCWDEPDFKAVFGVTLVVDDGLLAISNAPEVSSHVQADGKRVVRFADTMVMSTYLVAFVVGPLVASPSVDVNGTAMRVVHVPGKEHLTQFGLDAAIGGLKHFEDYYGIPYPGAKIDLVALPDFAAGAMENLGCITFREALLLIDPETSTHAEQQRVVDVVCHELAHMWFGDLVTMRWWNGIWLNEAFATFMETAATDAYRPDWNRWTAFALDKAMAFEVDSLASTRPVEFEVRSPADADGMFDVLTYEKGGALLRMLEQYLGPDRFRDGIRHYLTRHAYANTETSDLWDAIEASSGEPVRRLMDSWIWQPGFPLVSASIEGNALTLRQQRFAFAAPADGGSPDALWVVPVIIRAGGTTHRVLLDSTSATVALDNPDGVVVVNAGGHGFYRVSYDPTLGARLDAEALKGLETIERFNLAADMWSAVVAGRASAREFMTLAAAYEAESDPAVWQAVITGLRACDRLTGDHGRPFLAERVRRLVSPALDRLGWQRAAGESALTAQLRGLLVQTLALIGQEPDATARCQALVESAVGDAASAIDPELLAAATTVAAATGSASTYERFVHLYQQAVTPQEQLRFLYALAEFDDPDLVARTVDLSFSPEVKTQNAPYLIGRTMTAREHGGVAWTLLQQRWDDALRLFPGNSITRMLEGLRTLDRRAQVDSTATFFATHEVQQGTKTLTQILERQRINAALRERESGPLSNWLAAR